MIFPVIYAVCTWYFAALWRRRWRGLATLAISLSVLVAIYLATRRVNEIDDAADSMISFQVLLVPYTLLVGVVGMFIWSMPRPPLPAHHCAGCAYDLRGLDPSATRCPECGTPMPAPPPPDELIPIPHGPMLKKRSKR